MRKVWFGAVLALLITVLQVVPASAARVPVLSGTATYAALDQSVLFTNGCFADDVMDGTFSGQFIGGPVVTKVESGSTHLVGCANFEDVGIVDRGVVTLTTQIGTLTGTEVTVTNFGEDGVGLAIGTWTMTSGTGAYTKVTGTITTTAEVVAVPSPPPGVFEFENTGSMSFDLTR